MNPNRSVLKSCRSWDISNSQKGVENSLAWISRVWLYFPAGPTAKTCVGSWLNAKSVSAPGSSGPKLIFRKNSSLNLFGNFFFFSPNGGKRILPRYWIDPGIPKLRFANFPSVVLTVEFNFDQFNSSINRFLRTVLVQRQHNHLLNFEKTKSLSNPQFDLS